MHANVYLFRTNLKLTKQLIYSNQINITLQKKILNFKKRSR